LHSPQANFLGLYTPFSFRQPTPSFSAPPPSSLTTPSQHVLQIDTVQFNDLHPQFPPPLISSDYRLCCLSVYPDAGSVHEIPAGNIYAKYVYLFHEPLFLPRLLVLLFSPSGRCDFVVCLLKMSIKQVRCLFLEQLPFLETLEIFLFSLCHGSSDRWLVLFSKQSFRFLLSSILLIFSIEDCNIQMSYLNYVAGFVFGHIRNSVHFPFFLLYEAIHSAQLAKNPPFLRSANSRCSSGSSDQSSSPVLFWFVLFLIRKRKLLRFINTYT